MLSLILKEYHKEDENYLRQIFFRGLGGEVEEGLREQISPKSAQRLSIYTKVRHTLVFLSRCKVSSSSPPCGASWEVSCAHSRDQLNCSALLGLQQPPLCSGETQALAEGLRWTFSSQFQSENSHIRPWIPEFAST